MTYEETLPLVINAFTTEKRMEIGGLIIEFKFKKVL